MVALPAQQAQLAKASLTDGVVSSKAESKQRLLQAQHEVVGAEGAGKVLLHRSSAPCSQAARMKATCWKGLG